MIENAPRRDRRPTRCGRAAVVDRLLQRLLPDAVGGRAGWLLTRGLELLGAGSDRPLAEVVDGETTRALYLMSGTHEANAASYGSLRLVLRVVSFERGEVVDIHEREAFAGSLAPKDYMAPAATDESAAVAVVDAWREAAR